MPIKLENIKSSIARPEAKVFKPIANKTSSVQ